MDKPASLGNTLLALTASALAIPGLAPPAQAAGAPPASALPEDLPGQTGLDYRFDAYREGDIPAGKVASGNGRRFDVDTHQFGLATPLGGYDLSADLTYETMSGASPWYVLPGAGGTPVQVMSGATIRDERVALQLGLARRLGRYDTRLAAGYSTERDYHAATVGLEASRDFDSHLTTLSGGLGYTNDRLDPTEGDSARFPTRITHAQRYEAQAYGGVTRVLTATTQVQTSVSFTLENGYLSDPYKLAYVAGNLLQDARPHDRREWAWTTRLRQFIPVADAAVHLDYRFYGDEWNVISHTVELAWYQSLPAGWELVPRLRWYSQSQAAFYAPYYDDTRGDGYYSSDYRLSPFGALSLGLAAYKSWHGWNLSLRYEHYDSGAGYSIRSVEVENPGLVRFQVFGLSLGKTFE